MNSSRPHSSTTVSFDADPNTSLHGWWLTVARVGCLGIGLTAVIIWLWGVPLRYAQLGTVCSNVPCGDQQPTPASLAAFRAAGISLQFYSLFTGTVEVLFALVFLVLAATIFWRTSRSRIGLLTAAFLVTFGVTQTSADALAAAVPAWALPVNLLGSLSFVFLVLFLYLFPDGRFVPHWTRFVALAWIPIFLISSALMSPDNVVVPLFGFIAVSLGAQVYRFRRVSTPPQRQQTKWVVFGVLIGEIGSFVLIAAGNLLSLSSVFGTRFFFVGNTLIYACGALIPISIAFAIQRYRLYGIDTIINRTLVYGSLSAILAAIYFGTVVALQQVVRLVSGRAEQNVLVIVISTLLIAALFQPLRRGLQRGIDRRFFRAKYDAARTLATFGTALRQDVDLAELREHLVAVVEETLQPSHVSLWLRAPHRES